MCWGERVVPVALASLGGMQGSGCAAAGCTGARTIVMVLVASSMCPLLHTCCPCCGIRSRGAVTPAAGCHTGCQSTGACCAPLPLLSSMCGSVWGICWLQLVCMAPGLHGSQPCQQASTGRLCPHHAGCQNLPINTLLWLRCQPLILPAVLLLFLLWSQSPRHHLAALCKSQVPCT